MVCLRLIPTKEMVPGAFKMKTIVVQLLCAADTIELHLCTAASSLSLPAFKLHFLLNRPTPTSSRQPATTSGYTLQNKTLLDDFQFRMQKSS